MTPHDELLRASRRAVEMVRFWSGAPTRLLPAWAVLSATVLEGGDVEGPARDLVSAVVDRSGWDPEYRRVMDDLAAAVERAAQERAEGGAR